jgi:hypothetical protein
MHEKGCVLMGLRAFTIGFAGEPFYLMHNIFLHYMAPVIVNLDETSFCYSNEDLYMIIYGHTLIEHKRIVMDNMYNKGWNPYPWHDVLRDPSGRIVQPQPVIYETPPLPENDLQSSLLPNDSTHYLARASLLLPHIRQS